MQIQIKKDNFIVCNRYSVGQLTVSLINSLLTEVSSMHSVHLATNIYCMYMKKSIKLKTKIRLFIGATYSMQGLGKNFRKKIYEEVLYKLRKYYLMRVFMATSF